MTEWEIISASELRGAEEIARRYGFNPTYFYPFFFGQLVDIGGDNGYWSRYAKN
jgi:hypothetical protein